MNARSEERRGTNWIAMIRLADGTEIPCTVKDVSRSGACLGVPDNLALPETFLFKVLGRDFVCSARLVWRRDNHAGVMIEQVGKLRSPPPEDAPADPRRPAPPDAATSLRARRSRFAGY